MLDYCVFLLLGRYLYLDSLSAKWRDTAITRSPWFRSRAKRPPLCVVFCYHMYGEPVGGSRVYAFEKQKNVATGMRKILWEKFDDRGNLWYSTKVNYKQESIVEVSCCEKGCLRIFVCALIQSRVLLSTCSFIGRATCLRIFLTSPLITLPYIKEIVVLQCRLNGLPFIQVRRFLLLSVLTRASIQLLGSAFVDCTNSYNFSSFIMAY